MKKQIERISLEQIPRKFNFPLPVKHIGFITIDHDRFKGNHYNSIEFCIRLKSIDAFAFDKVGDTVCKSRFPHLFIKRPPSLHTYEYSGEREAFFIIYPSNLKPALEAMGIPFDRYNYEFEPNSSIEYLVRELRSLFAKVQTPGVADEIDALSWALIQKIYNSPRKTAAKPDLIESKIRSAASFLDVHYAEKHINMQELAAKNGLSLRNFYRCWKKYYTLSPADKILELKLTEAQRQLENQSLSVAEIAENLHFGNPAWFIVKFKQKFKKTPLQYRQYCALKNHSSSRISDT